VTEPLFAPDTRRRLALALIAYGVVGLVLAVAVAVAGVMGALRIDDVTARIEAQRVELVAAVGTTTDLVGTLADTLVVARPGLDQVTTSAGRLSALADQISTTADDLAGRLDVQILGLQPFAGMGVQVRGIAEQTRGLSSDLETIAPAITAASESTGSIADGLWSLETRLSNLEARMAALGPFDEYGRWLLVGLVLVVLLDLWLAIPAALAIVVGRRLRRVSEVARD
jgi:methyl-accepting chemotaxis protein